MTFSGPRGCFFTGCCLAKATLLLGGVCFTAVLRGDGGSVVVLSAVDV